MPENRWEHVKRIVDGRSTSATRKSGSATAVYGFKVALAGRPAFQDVLDAG